MLFLFRVHVLIPLQNSNGAIKSGQAWSFVEKRGEAFTPPRLSG
jgi:hypothetical protein